MGRPLGELRGRTEQANEFARWLRMITRGVTVRRLESDLPYGRSSWSGFRDGSRLPEASLVKRVTDRYLHEPVMRQRQAERGLALLRAAEQAAKALQDQEENPSLRGDLSGLLSAQRKLDPVTAALLRLDDARLRQIEAMQALSASERRREELEAMISVLEQRITVLEGERERAREDVRAELQRELQMSREYRRQAGESLSQAQQAVERARWLRLAAEKQVAQQRNELRHVASPQLEGPTPSSVPGETVADELQLPPLHRIQEFLDANREQMDSLHDELDELGEELGEPDTRPHDQAPAPRIVQGAVLNAGDPADVVHDQALDKPRKPRTSPLAAPAPQPDGSPSAPAAPLAPTARHAPSTALLAGLHTADTPEALAKALGQLLRRSAAHAAQPSADELAAELDDPPGPHTMRQLANELPAEVRDDVLRATVGRWVDGDTLPDAWPHLEALIKVMGVTNDEAVAFRDAYERIVHAKVANAVDWSPKEDLSELMSFRRGVRRFLRRRAPRGHER
ncbi:hypothetical protein [Streptomyces sp. NPDC049813]|uniref:hypothetical protein n=1 Tax=Streptomyces sp. NPDC049813 TaxID=3365597 RepID=UPI0037A3481E